MLRRLFTKHIAEEVGPMLRLATPIVMAELGWMTMGIVDTMMVGRQDNSALAIGAVSLGGMLYYVVAIFGTGLMLGLDTLVSHSYGAGDMEDAHRWLVNGVYLSFAMAPALMLIVRLMVPLGQHLGIQESLLGQTVPYLRALNWSTFPLLLYFVFRRYLQGINLAKPVIFSLVTANLLNVVGNWALIYGRLGLRAMGTVGSGWATCIGRIYMAAFLMVYCVYYDLRYTTGLRDASRWPHMP
jgi:MATE family multidrug resistance protein